MRVHAFPKHTPPEIIKAIIAGRDPKKEAVEREKAENNDKQHQENIAHSKAHIETLQLIAVGLHKLIEKKMDFSTITTEIKALTKAVINLEKCLKSRK